MKKTILLLSSAAIGLGGLLLVLQTNKKAALITTINVPYHLPKQLAFPTQDQNNFLVATSRAIQKLSLSLQDFLRISLPKQNLSFVFVRWNRKNDKELQTQFQRHETNAFYQGRQHLMTDANEYLFGMLFEKQRLKGRVCFGVSSSTGLILDSRAHYTMFFSSLVMTCLLSLVAIQYKTIEVPVVILNMYPSTYESVELAAHASNYVLENKTPTTTTLTTRNQEKISTGMYIFKIQQK